VWHENGGPAANSLGPRRPSCHVRGQQGNNHLVPMQYKSSG
jgi:hypothetical protein